MGLSKETIHAWLNVGYFAPSGDNVQPWIITLPDDHTVLLTLNFEIEHILDKRKSASLISLGCFYECLVQSCGHFGVKIESSIFKEKVLTLRISSQSKIDSAVSLLKIKSRVTDRGDYQKLDVPSISFLNSIISKEKNVVFYQNLPRSIISTWSDLDYSMWKKTRLMEDFLKWIRITRPEDTFFGLSVYSLGLKWWEVFGLYIFKMIHFFGFSLKSLIFKSQFKKIVKRFITSDYIFFWESKIDDDVIFNLGRKLQRVWMELNYVQISAQPLTVQSMIVSEFCYNREELGKHFPKECMELADAALLSMQPLREAPDVSLPVFILRVGKTQKQVASHGRKFFSEKPENKN